MRITHTFNSKRAEIFDQYGLIIFHQQVYKGMRERAINAGKGTMEKAKENGTIG